jgi:type II secretory pathway pseudopilin PulG
MNEPPKQRWGCLQWGIVAVVLVLLASLIIPEYNAISRMGDQTRAVSNCKQIVLALKQYANENESAYPDGRAGIHSANQAFRELFKTGILEEESIFGCPKSEFIPDNEIGSAPDFMKTLSSGECHWMLVKGQSDESSGNMPLVFENTLDVSWPPRWDGSAPEGRRKRGQAWRVRGIIIGRNDGSVQMEKLRDDGSLDWRSTEGLDTFGKERKSWPAKQAERFTWLDIEEK